MKTKTDSWPPSCEGKQLPRTEVVANNSSLFRADFCIFRQKSDFSRNLPLPFSKYYFKQEISGDIVDTTFPVPSQQAYRPSVAERRCLFLLKTATIVSSKIFCLFLGTLPNARPLSLLVLKLLETPPETIHFALIVKLLALFLGIYCLVLCSPASVMRCLSGIKHSLFLQCQHLAWHTLPTSVHFAWSLNSAGQNHCHLLSSLELACSSCTPA